MIYLYDEPRAKTLDINLLGEYIKEKLPSRAVEIRPEIFSFALENLPQEQRKKAIGELAEKLARAKVRSESKLEVDFAPLKGEIDFERRRLEGEARSVFGLLYDGFRLMEIIRRLIPQSERTLKNLHIVFTNQLIGTWDEASNRYHARATVYGFPSIISTSGLVEGPAKPKEYYFIKQQAALLGQEELALAEFKEKHQAEFIDYDDPRLNEVLKGYLVQAIVYQATGEAFCQDPDCRLYNAHWQSELIQAQLGGKYEFCPYHEGMLKK